MIQLGGADGVQAVFEDIPDCFVETYREKFVKWGKNFKNFGRTVIFTFYRKPGAMILLNPDGSKVQQGASLTAELDRSVKSRPRLIIRPSSERDKELIAEHSRYLQNIFQ